MIGLSIGGRQLDMYPDTEISFRLISPVFSSDIGDNSHTLSFNLPGSPLNEEILGRYENPLVRGSQVVYNQVTLWMDGLPIMEGNLVVNRAQGRQKSFSARFETDLSPVAPVLKETLLVDLDLGGRRDIAGYSTSNAVLEITFSTYNQLAVLVLNGIVYSVYWYTGLDEPAILNLFAGQINTDSDNNHCTASVSGVGPAAQLTIAALPGFSTVDVEINHPDNKYVWTLVSESGFAAAIHDAVIAHMNAVATSPIGSYDYYFFPIFNEGFYDGQNSDWLNYVNLWDWDTNSFVKNTSNVLEQWRNSAVPLIRTAYLLERICAHIGYTDISTFTQTPEFQGHCLWNNVSLDQERHDGTDFFNGFRSYIDIKDHLPEDWTCADLIIYIRDTFNLSFELNNKEKTLRFFEKQLIPRQDQIDWRDRSLNAYGISRKPEDQRGFNFTYVEDDNDSFFLLYKTQFRDKITDAGYQTKESKIAPLTVQKQPYPLATGNWLIPAINQNAKTVHPDVSDNGYQLRAGIFYGLHEGDQAGKDYPFATLGDKDHAGTVIGNYSLSWGNESEFTEKGLLETFWDLWLNGREEEAEWEQLVYLDLESILALAYDQPYRLRVQEGEIDGVMKELAFDLSRQGVKNGVAKFFRL